MQRCRRAGRSWGGRPTAAGDSSVYSTQWGKTDYASSLSWSLSNLLARQRWHLAALLVSHCRAAEHPAWGKPGWAPRDAGGRAQKGKGIKLDTV